MIMQDINDDILRVAALSLGGRAERVSRLPRWMHYSFDSVSFFSHGMRMPFDEPSVIERANNKLISRDILGSRAQIVGWRLIDTHITVRVSGEHEWVLKPVAGKKGIGVIPRLRPEEVPEYSEVLSKHSRFLFLEPYVNGKKLRVLVLDSKIIGVSAHEAPVLTGDGTHTVLELMESMPEVSPLSYGSRLMGDTEVKHALRYQKLCETAIPESGIQFYPTFVVNISRGAHWRRMASTQKGLEYVIAISKSAANAVGLRLAGVDVIVPDHGEPVILEVNPSPGIVGHTWDPDEKMVDLKPAQGILNAAIDCFGQRTTGTPKFTSVSLDKYLAMLNDGVP